jgi:hypothetical protein
MIPSPPDAVKNFSVESSIMAHYRVDAPTAGWAHESGDFITPPGGEAQAVEVVNDELKVLEANGFAKKESTTRQTLAISSDGDRRWWNHRNV